MQPDDPHTSLPSYKDLAARLEKKLSLDSWHPQDRQLLSPKQCCLLSDTRGLLRAIATGVLATGTNRIVTNLLDFAAMFPANTDFTESSVYGNPLKNVQEVIETAAQNRLSIAGEDLRTVRSAYVSPTTAL